MLQRSRQRLGKENWRWSNLCFETHSSQFSQVNGCSHNIVRMSKYAHTPFYIKFSWKQQFPFWKSHILGKLIVLHLLITSSGNSFKELLMSDTDTNLFFLLHFCLNLQFTYIFAKFLIKRNFQICNESSPPIRSIQYCTGNWKSNYSLRIYLDLYFQTFTENW